MILTCFTILCDEMVHAHTALMLHTEGRWLPRGKASVPLSCEAELVAFVMEDHFYLKEHLTDTCSKVMVKLRYLTDIFSKVNEHNLSL